MNYEQIKPVRDARFYASLNLLKSEIDGSAASDTKVNKAFRLVMTHAHADRGGREEWSAQVNAAKQCLLDTKQRQLYNDALQRFSLKDG